jgi:hypothetical protein
MYIEFRRLELSFNLIGFFQELVPHDFPFGMKVEIHQLPDLPSSLRTSSPTSGGPSAPSGSL